jgi:hypothetical protein
LSLVAALAVYGLLLVPTVARQGISWDEQTDLLIARAYLASPDGWLVGSPSDPSQTRLPMFVVAILYRLLGVSDLLTGRYASMVVGALTIAGCWVLARRLFGESRAAVASMLLATSPFFLSFARVAFTETDVYLACTLIWLLVALETLRSSTTVGRAATVGLLLGLCLSAKATALALLPAAWFALWEGGDGKGERVHAAQPAAAGLVAALAMIATVGVAQSTPAAGWSAALRWQLIGAAALAWIAVVGWAVRQRRAAAHRVSLGAFFTGLALLTAVIVPPDHLTNPAILQGLFSRLDHEVAWKAGFMLEAAVLHVLSIAFKSGLLVGAWILVSALISVVQLPSRVELRVPLLAAAGYFVGLEFLPIAQTYYVVPLLPVLMVLAADQFLRLSSRMPSLALPLAGAAVLLLGSDLARCYPDYNLNGYQWLGARALAGRPSIGYRSVVYTPSDGVQQEFEWLNANAAPGKVVLSYVRPWHIVFMTSPFARFRVVDGSQRRVPSPDYVVTEINALLPWEVAAGSGDDVFRLPYDPAWLEKNYTKVFAVTRAFGIEVATVWQRREAPPAHAPGVAGPEQVPAPGG